MSKPLGIGVTISGSGIGLAVTRSDRVENKIWEAVEEAIDAGWDGQMFRREAASAFRHTLEKHAKWAEDDLLRGNDL